MNKLCAAVGHKPARLVIREKGTIEEIRYCARCGKVLRKTLVKIE